MKLRQEHFRKLGRMISLTQSPARPKSPMSDVMLKHSTMSMLANARHRPTPGNFYFVTKNRSLPKQSHINYLDLKYKNWFMFGWRGFSQELFGKGASYMI